jgi:hypothetical protein
MFDRMNDDVEGSSVTLSKPYLGFALAELIQTTKSPQPGQTSSPDIFISTLCCLTSHHWICVLTQKTKLIQISCC